MGGEIDMNTKEYLDQQFKHLENIFTIHKTTNDKEHADFKVSIAQLSEIVAQDRVEMNNKFDKVIDSMTQIAVLNSQMKDIKKITEDRRIDVHELYNRTDVISKDMNNLADAIRKSTEVKLKIYEDELSEANDKITSLEKQIARATGWTQALNWALTIGLAAIVAIFELFRGK
jgi:chromosome segregation ATPase